MGSKEGGGSRATLHPTELILSVGKPWAVIQGTEILLQHVAVWGNLVKDLREWGIWHKSCLTPSVLKTISLQDVLQGPFSPTPPHSRRQWVWTRHTTVSSEGRAEALVMRLLPYLEFSFSLPKDTTSGWIGPAKISTSKENNGEEGTLTYGNKSFWGSMSTWCYA